MEQKPTVGRLVHFTPPQECVGPSSLTLYPAIITQVNTGTKVPTGTVNTMTTTTTGSGGTDETDTVELATFGPNSLYFQHGIKFSVEPKPGCWSWPART